MRRNSCHTQDILRLHTPIAAPHVCVYLQIVFISTTCEFNYYLQLFIHIASIWMSCMSWFLKQHWCILHIFKCEMLTRSDLNYDRVYGVCVCKRKTFAQFSHLCIINALHSRDVCTKCNGALNISHVLHLQTSTTATIQFQFMKPNPFKYLCI